MALHIMCQDLALQEAYTHLITLLWSTRLVATIKDQGLKKEKIQKHTHTHVLVLPHALLFNW